jgi:5-methylthioadenosine/S-adenosylhomocysteine deaminase
MAGAEGADILIRNAYVVTVDPERRVFTDGYVAFRDGKISAIGAMDDLAITARETIDARGRMLLPGIANAHKHLIQIAFRGYNDDRWPVLDIPTAVAALLRQLYAITARTDGARSYALTRLHLLDMLKAGYTATHDEHFTNIQPDSVDGSWAAVRDSGMRGFLARCTVSDRVPEAAREDVDHGLSEVERLRGLYNSDRIQVVPGILNFSFFDDPEDMRRIGEGARRMGAPLDIDMTDNSRGALLRARGFEGGQVDFYRSFDLLDRPLYAGKAVNLLPHEYALLKAHDARAAVVPILRFFDGGGYPVHHLLREGLLPAIGTDAPLVSDCQNPFEIMRQIILAQTIASHRERAEGRERPDRAHWVVAETAIEMATLGGARTLFMEDVAGSIAVGKAADCILVDTSGAAMQPDMDGARRIGSLVWAGNGAIVDTVFVAGRKLLEGGRSTIWDEDEVVRDAARALRECASEAGIETMLPTRRKGESYRGWTYV